MGVSLGRQASPRSVVERALVQRAQHLGVALRAHDHDHGLVVLGGRPDHRRPADVDLLDRLLDGGVPAKDRVDERVEVAADEVDLAQAVLGQRGEVLRPVAPRQDARVHARVQRLDAAVHHLGEAGEVPHGAGVERSLLDRLQGAARGEELVTETLQPARERREPGLVANGQKSCRQVAPPSA